MTSKLKKENRIKARVTSRKDASRTKDFQSSTLSRSESIQLLSELTVLYQTASTNNDIGDIFLLFSKISQQFCRKEKVKRKQKADFVLWVDKTLKLLMQVVNTQKPVWKTVFHEYCLNCLPHRMKAFSFHNVENFIRLMLEYLSILQSEDCSEIPTITFCLSLVRYFECHKMDSLGCLVGLKASKDVVDGTIKIRKENQATKSVKTTPLEIKTFTEQEIQKILQQNEILLEKIIEWACIEEPLHLQQVVREYAGELRGTKEIEIGALIISEIEKDNYIFTRFTGEKMNDNCLNIYTSPLENESISIRIDKAFPLKGTILQKVREYEVNDLEKFVQLSTDTLYHDEMANVNNRLNEYLISVNVDMDVIKKANDNECSISELNQLKVAQTTLEEVKRNPPIDLINELQNSLQSKVSNIILKQDQINLFKPLRKKTIEQLLSFHVRELINMNITRHIGVCYSALDQLKLQKRELMNGVRKENLVSWWLDEIDKTVMEYLTNLGYQADAIPENYAEEAPSDLDLVYKNLALLDDILKVEDPHCLSAVIQKMKDKIYPKINLFIDDAKIVLSEQFGMDLTCENFSIDRIQKAYNREKNKIDPLVSVWIDDIIKDLNYLSEMKELEDPNYPKERSLHIVPISGLVVGVICRFQNECRTVIEFWEKIDSPRMGDYDIHQATLNGDIFSITEQLIEQPSLVNSVDSFGSTPLILSCQNFDYPICLALLQSDIIDVNIQNINGCTALHSLCTIKSLDNVAQIEEIVTLILSKNPQLTLLSKKNQSVFDLCAMNDHHHILKLLLQNNITPQIVDECIKVAIKHHSHKVLRVISESGIPFQTPNSEDANNNCCIKLLKAVELSPNHNGMDAVRQWSSVHGKERKHIHIALARKGVSSPQIINNNN